MADFIPIARVVLDEAEIAEAVATLRSGWITTGPRVAAFEEACKAYLGCGHAVALTSGTAAMHLGLMALGVGPGDEVITTPLTFASTVSSILFVGAKPVLVDVDPATLQISPEAVAAAISPLTAAVLPVHYGGAACDLDGLGQAVETSTVGMRRNRPPIAILEDAALAFGATHAGRRVGAASLAACFSFHPVKNLTTAEGGLFVTNDPQLERRVRLASWHGIEKSALARYKERSSWFFEVESLGYKYNMTDLSAGIGIHQLARIEKTNAARRRQAAYYDEALRGHEGVKVAPETTEVDVRLPYWMVLDSKMYDRNRFIEEMTARRVGTAVHYVPIHLQRYYRERFGWQPGLCPVAEAAYTGLVSIPVFATLTDDEMTRVRVAALESLEACRR